MEERDQETCRSGQTKTELKDMPSSSFRIARSREMPGRSEASRPSHCIFGGKVCSFSGNAVFVSGPHFSLFTEYNHRISSIIIRSIKLCRTGYSFVLFFSSFSSIRLYPIEFVWG